MGDAVEVQSSGPREEKDQKQIDEAKKLHNIPWCEQYERMISGML
jgi:hypothetical protein